MLGAYTHTYILYTLLEICPDVGWVEARTPTTATDDVG